MTTRPTPTSSRGTRRSVHVIDKIAEAGICSGGAIVLLAVLGICVYLIWVVAPLFRSGSATPGWQGELALAPRVRVIDEHQQCIASIDDQARLIVAALRSGETLQELPLAPESATMTAAVAMPGGELVALGFSDGSVRIGSISFRAALLSDAAGSAPDATPRAVRTTWSGVPSIDADGDVPAVLSIADSGDRRLTSPVIEFGPPIPSQSGGVTYLDVAITPGGNKLILAAFESGEVGLSRIIERRPLGGGPPRIALSRRLVQLPPGLNAARLLVSGDGSSVLAISADLRGIRLAPRLGSPDDSPLVPVEDLDLAIEPGRRLSSVEKLRGGLTFLVGDDAGGIASFALARDPTAPGDAQRLRPGSIFRRSGPAVVGLAPSPRDRSFAAATAAGEILVYHATSGKRLARVRMPGDQPPSSIILAPRNDGLIAIGPGRDVRAWTLDPGFSDVSFNALFGPQEYEGELKPQFIYQSSAGASEPKLSLIPLIFGTIKATIFAMIFAGPIAVLGAIYTSEFCSPGARRIVKPTIELMASLPSVVLGFVAAMVVAPMIAEHLPWALAALVTVPLTVVVGAWAWHAVPSYRLGRLRGLSPVVLILGLLAVGVGLAGATGPAVERALFRPTASDIAVLTGNVTPIADDEVPSWVGRRQAMSPDEQRRLRREGLAFQNGRVVRPAPPEAGTERDAWLRHAVEAGVDEPSFRRWLDGVIADPTPGWVVLLAPLGGTIGLLTGAAWRGSGGVGAQGPASPAARAILASGLAAITAASGLLLAWLCAGALADAGLDPRDSIFGTFSPRNTFVVGIIMGFAIIPIIYTISEDAMRGVPDALRLASLGSGATQWQTAIRVVVPVATSGIFSACMIGLGRAVGETMIVLMATGATPEMNWNIFAGFRTLAANIAIELPEARAGSTHYRVLFLCGLVLFAFTIVINTTAEFVRRRVRKRIAGL